VENIMDEIIQNHVFVDPEVQHGKPCFRGTRTPVYVVLELLEAGVSPEQITGPDYFPSLTTAHVRAALHFAADYARNQEYIPFPKAG
jgi:uncharacterized protein (DUF433 family)